MVERPLCMREVPGSIPGFSICFVFLIYLFLTVLILPDNFFVVPIDSNNLSQFSSLLPKLN